MAAKATYVEGRVTIVRLATASSFWYGAATLLQELVNLRVVGKLRRLKGKMSSIWVSRNTWLNKVKRTSMSF
jgi:hypothetical protein